MAVFAFLAFSALGTLAVLWANRLFRTYRRPFLQPYTLHLAFWNALALVQITQYILGKVFFAGGAAESLALALWPLFIVLTGLSLYFLMVATADLRRRTTSRALRITYLSLWGAVVVIQAILLSRSSSGAPESILRTSAIVTALLKTGTVLGCMAWLVLPSRDDDPSERRFRRHFAGAYLAGYALFQLSARGNIPVYALPFGDYVIALIQFGFHFPPLMILSRYLGRQAVSRPPDIAGADLAVGLEPLGVSPREAEIAGLVLRGYSNREIEKRLFISVETVKKHVSNIYRKLGVKNRVQLSNFVQNRCGVRPEDVPAPLVYPKRNI